MKLERISLPVGADETRAVDLHPGLTVVEATPGHEATLVRSLVGSLGSAGDGVHVEFTSADGSYRVAFRPVGAAHRVIDVASHADVTGSYLQGDQGIDLLAGSRAVGRVLETDLVAGAEDLQQQDPTTQWMARLGAADVERLLSAAAEQVAVEEELQRATAVAQAAPDVTATAQQLKEAHERADIAERRHNRSRVATLAVGTTVPVAAVVGLNTVGTAGALGLLGGTLAVTVGCFIYGRRLEHAIDAENATVERLRNAAAGTNSTSADPTSADPTSADPTSTDAARTDTARAGGADDSARGALLAAAERYHATAKTWHDLAGTVPAPWVLSQSDRLRRAAALRVEVGVPAAEDGESLSEGPRSHPLLVGLTDRVAANRALSGDADPLPLFLEDPLRGLEWSEKASVLEFLGRLSRHQQTILVTADQEVLGWARLEAMTGGVGIAAGPAVEADIVLDDPVDGRVEPTIEGS